MAHRALQSQPPMGAHSFLSVFYYVSDVDNHHVIKESSYSAYSHSTKSNIQWKGKYAVPTWSCLQGGQKGWRLIWSFAIYRGNSVTQIYPHQPLKEYFFPVNAWNLGSSFWGSGLVSFGTSCKNFQGTKDYYKPASFTPLFNCLIDWWCRFRVPSAFP